MSGRFPQTISILVPKEEIGSVEAFADPEFFEIVGAAEFGVDFRGEDPQTFIQARAFVAAATWNERLLESLKRARKQLEECASAYLPDIYILEGERNISSLQNLVIFSLKGLLQRQAEDASLRRLEETRQQLREVQLRAETFQRDLTELTKLVTGFGVEKIERVFAGAPSGVLADEGAAGGSVTQALPVSGDRLCGFELHVSSPAAQTVPMTLKLFGREEANPIAHWSVLSPQPGWNRFALTGSLDIASQPLRLEIGSASGLSLGPQTQEISYQVARRGTPLADRMLAMRLYVALPGAGNAFVGEPAVATMERR